MKFASVALSALAVSLATPLAAQQAPAPAPAQNAQRSFPMTPAGAKAFVDMVERDMFDYSVRAGRVYWVNATYITDDTDALAAQVGAEGTEKSVRYALEAAKYARVPGLAPDVARKLDILRNGIVLPAPTTPGAATELNEIATDLQSQYGKGRGTLERTADQRQRYRGPRWAISNARLRNTRRCGPAGTTMSVRR